MNDALAMTIELDHLVFAAHTLEQGVAAIGQALGVQPTGGGRHDAMGTHNKVLRLGDGQYLEVIAIDPRGAQPATPRWFGLDDPAMQQVLRERPRLITWVARTTALCDDISALPVPITVRSLSRGALHWQFGFTVDGALIGDGVIPHLIEWDADAAHPTIAMPNAGLRLVGLRGFHVRPEAVSASIAALGLSRQCVVRKTAPMQPASLQAMIETPDGVVILE